MHVIKTHNHPPAEFDLDEDNMEGNKGPKRFWELHGKPIIIYTLEIFEEYEDIDAILVACIKEWIPYLENLIEKFQITKVKKVVSGGRAIKCPFIMIWLRHHFDGKKQ